MFTNRYPIIVCYAIALHLIQALSLVVEPSAAGVTSIHAIMDLFNSRWVTAGAFAAVATAAIAGLLVQTRRASVILMLPQQFLLFVAMLGAVRAIYAHQFADGVPRPMWFLIADQSPTILATIGHTVAILALMRVKTWNHG